MLSKLLSTGRSAGHTGDLELLVLLDLGDDVPLLRHVQDAQAFQGSEHLDEPLLRQLEQHPHLIQRDVDAPPLVRQREQVRQRTPHVLRQDTQARVPPQVDVQLHPLLH